MFHGVAGRAGAVVEVTGAVGRRDAAHHALLHPKAVGVLVFAHNAPRGGVLAHARRRGRLREVRVAARVALAVDGGGALHGAVSVIVGLPQLHRVAPITLLPSGRAITFGEHALSDSAA